MIETEIHTLLDAPAHGVGAPPLSLIEDTLTAGYAHALAIEAERWRLERRIAEVAAELGDEPSNPGTSELRKLSRNLRAANNDLTRLRALLGSLRDRANEVRAAVA